MTQRELPNIRFDLGQPGPQPQPEFNTPLIQPSSNLPRTREAFLPPISCLERPDINMALNSRLDALSRSEINQVLSRCSSDGNNFDMTIFDDGQTRFAPRGRSLGLRVRF